ncbi:MBL fold metallo-hydrolase [Arenibacter echinorum]|uniref:L-ascorbate metabolism protein UlaG (Beta-lactamase superfamily) n=1 Tax=Arenibacter echinorum TaxID=440515 RepID=A0A327R9H8_9FLAO|nr:MBL fold metallo-hydrolase [Arenibacter echinorum]RAJ12818.1 L-ascorbate metabolism protein UlaG (beta-lactamase superfamily) [Arenibacter echinorum]
MSIVIGSGLLFVIVIGVLFLYLSPEFGGAPTLEQKRIYDKSPNYINGKFINKGNVKLDMSMRDMGKSLAGFFGPTPLTKPSKDIPVAKLDSLNIVEYQDSTRLIWFGHSAFLLQISNKTILIDPMFGKVPAPHPMLGSNRFSKELPIEVEKLPRIDAVIISHDHYDHLDYGSIQKLKNKVNMFYTPLGVGAHLQKWGVEKERIVELDWWQEVTHEGLVFKCTPAQHFSGRGFSDRANTLWSSWVIQSEKDNVFFSGDSGYGPHFKEIGDKYGPFDFAMIECGQYNEMWPDIHMFPEQTAQAGLDVKAKQIMPIHWGAFKLAMHPWTEPVERVTNRAKELNLDVLTPRIGEPINLNRLEETTSHWWK